MSGPSPRRVERRLRDPSQRRKPFPTRIVHAWRTLPSERRLAAIASIALFLTLFLPWYQETVIAGGLTSLRSTGASLTGWAAFSFVEAAVLLVAVGVLALLFARAEGRAFHVPGGDGGVIMAAGVWTCLLIVWRIFDKEGTSGHGELATTSGVEWGIFVALGVAALLAYSGSRIRRAREPEPPLPGERVPAHDPYADQPTAVEPVIRRRRPRSLVSDDATAVREPGPAVEPDDDDATLTRERGPAPREGRDASARGPLDRSLIEELDIAEPPPSRLSRIPSRFAPSEPDEPDEPDDDLTLRHDRPR